MERGYFADLIFPGTLHKNFKNSTDPAYLEIRNRIENVWKSAPEKLVNRFIDLSDSNFTGYRGLIFELYILEQLCLGEFEISYEYDGFKNSSQIDYFVKRDDFEFGIEVTTLGPNESGLINNSLELDPNGYQKVRDVLRSKLKKVAGDIEVPTILAVCNSNSNFLASRFEHVQTLFGTPAVRLHIESGESDLVLSDEGFWISDLDDARGYSAIYFSRGWMPGFSFMLKPQIWLNPSATNPLPLEIWPAEVDFYKAENEIYFTNKSLNFVWEKVDSILD